jgi:hypothetical protein
MFPPPLLLLLPLLLPLLLRHLVLEQAVVPSVLLLLRMRPLRPLPLRRCCHR